MTDDAELLRCYAEEKSEEAFAELVRRRIGLVYSVAWRHTRDAHRAEEVTQAVFTALARKAGTLARRPVLVGWLYRSAQFAASDAVRVEVRRQAREQEAHTMNESEREAPEPDWPALRPVLDEGLSALEERDRDAVLLRFFDGWSFAEIGTKLNLTENAARMRVERALGKLHTALARRGVKSTATALGVALSGQAGVAAPVGLAASVAAGALVAGVSSAGLGMAGILTSMSTLKTAVSMGVAVVAIGFGVYETQQRSRADAATAEARDESDRLRTRLNATEALAARLEKRAAQAEEQRAALERKTRGLFSNQTVSGAGLPLNSSAGQSSEGQLILSATPTPADPKQARQHVRNINRRAVHATYSPFYRKLGFTAEESYRFDELVLDNNERGSALFKKAVAQSPARDRESLQTIGEVIQDQNHASLGTLVSGAFGDKIGGEFQRFQETIALRPVTSQLASALFYTATPLTTAQAEQLVDIMAQSARSANGKVNPVEMDKSAVLAASRGVLSAPQIEALSGFLDQTIGRGATKR